MYVEFYIEFLKIEIIAYIYIYIYITCVFLSGKIIEIVTCFFRLIGSRNDISILEQSHFIF